MPKVRVDFSMRDGTTVLSQLARAVGDSERASEHDPVRSTRVQGCAFKPDCRLWFVHPTLGLNLKAQRARWEAAIR